MPLLSNIQKLQLWVFRTTKTGHPQNNFRSNIGIGDGVTIHCESRDVVRCPAFCGQLGQDLAQQNGPSVNRDGASHMSWKATLYNSISVCNHITTRERETDSTETMSCALSNLCVIQERYECMWENWAIKQRINVQCLYVFDCIVNIPALLSSNLLVILEIV